MVALLDIKGLRVEFPSRRGHVVAIQDLTLELAPGEILGVVGESGAGKSTIGAAVSGLLEPPGEVTGGEVRLKGERIDNLDEHQRRAIRGRRIGMIFQDPLTSLDPLQTIERQLIDTIDHHLAVGEKEARARAVNLLDQVGIPDPNVRIAQYPHQFSGGMRQRVVIALALAAEPELVIADEPTTALDVSVQAQILELLKSLCREKQVGMILITHDMGVIADTADRVCVMYRGRVVETGVTTQIIGAPRHDYTKSLISAIPRPDRRSRRFPLVTYIEGEEERPEKIDLGSHWLGQSRDFGAGEDVMLKAEDLRMEFLTQRSMWRSKRKYLRAVDDVSFEIRSGEVFGLVGESGSGKSTIARLVTGIYRPSGGSVTFAGQDLTALKTRAEAAPWRRQMQMIFQDPFSSLNGRMRVRDIVAEPIHFHRLAGSREEAQKIVKDLLELVGLGAAAAVRFPHEFSGGQRQRISIARALATRPRFLICDEPTSALDVSIQAQILNLLKDLQEQLQLSVLFISHDLPVIRQMCDRVGVMRHGKLLEVAETETLFQRPSHEYSRHLLDLMPKLEGLRREEVMEGQSVA
ncbi:MAG: ABC transporter ATP-binding protein [Rhodobacteraceae bacterium]|nr:ABC transporter ATP-binding protein [Paracoccaceae bacterium]